MDPLDIRYFKMAIGSDRIKHETPTDITARCPICGDSKYSKSKARLHLYEKNGITLVNCFNECSVQNKTVEKFLKEFYPSLLSSYKDEKFKDNLINIKSLKNFSDTDNLGDFDEYYRLFDRSGIHENSDGHDDICNNNINNQIAKPAVLFDLSSNFKKDDNTVSEYCNSRKITYNSDNNWYIGRNITIDGRKYPIENYLIIPLFCNNKMYGFYSRSMSEHKFYTYIPDKNTGFKVWNLYNIDITKPVYVFEGIFDALSAYQCGITNVIACLGATPPMDLLNEFDLIFCLDNDRTGYINSIRYLKMGYKALIYPNDIHYKDTNEMLKAGIDIKNLILNNIGSGILAQVKIQRKL